MYSTKSRCNRRMTNNSYKLPTKQETNGPLLDANFVAYQAESIHNLLSKVQKFRMCIFGDSATVLKTPIIVRKRMHAMFARKCCGT